MKTRLARSLLRVLAFGCVDNPGKARRARSLLPIGAGAWAAGLAIRKLRPGLGNISTSRKSLEWIVLPALMAEPRKPRQHRPRRRGRPQNAHAPVPAQRRCGAAAQARDAFI